MDFTVMDRIWLGLLLPKDAASLMDYRILHDLKLALSIPEDERKAINFRTEGQRVMWNPDAPSKSIEVGDRAKAIIVETLERAAKTGPVNEENIGLFEMFGVEG